MLYYQTATTKQTKINELKTIPFINKYELMRPSKGIVTVSYSDVFSYLWIGMGAWKISPNF